MPNVSSPLGTTQAYIPLFNSSQLARAAGMSIHFPTEAALQAALVAERLNITNSAPLWSDGQALSCAGEPIGTKRYWNATAPGDARRVVLPGGPLISLLADTNYVTSTGGAPLSGFGTNGDVAVDVSGNAYYTKTAGTWVNSGALKVLAFGPVDLGTGAIALTAVANANRANRAAPIALQNVTVDTTGGTIGDLYGIASLPTATGNIVMPSGFVVAPGKYGCDEWEGGSIFISTVNADGVGGGVVPLAVTGATTADATLTATRGSGYVGALQWQADSGSGFADISGQTTATFSPTVGGVSYRATLGGFYNSNAITTASGGSTLFEMNFGPHALQNPYVDQAPNIDNTVGNLLLAKVQGAGGAKVNDGGDHNYGQLDNMCRLFYDVERTDCTFEAFVSGGGSMMYFMVRDDGGLSNPFVPTDTSTNNANGYRIAVNHATGHVTMYKITAGVQGSELLAADVASWVDTDHVWKLVMGTDNNLQIKCADVNVGGPIALTGTGTGVSYEGRNGGQVYCNDLKAYFP